MKEGLESLGFSLCRGLYLFLFKDFYSASKIEHLVNLSPQESMDKDITGVPTQNM